MKYLTKNIFLDTNIYEENNFFHSSNIQSLFYYSRINVINLFMTHISKMELIDRMKKRIIETKDDHNKLVKSINKSRILKNLKKYEEFEKSTLKVNESLSELTNKLETIIRTSNIKILPTNYVNIDSIFDAYYRQIPPFGKNESKKYEFPDAFIIKTVDNWCRKNKKKIFFLTKDSDFSGYKSKRILFNTDLSSLLERITLYYDSMQEYKIIPSINESINRNNEDLLNFIENGINELLIVDLDFEKVSNFEWKIESENYKITALRPTYAEVTYNVKFTVDYTVLPDLIDIHKSVFNDVIRPIKITQHMTIPCDLEINFTEINNIKIKWINSNHKIIIRNE